MSLREKLFAVQSAVSKVHKDGSNPHTKKNYATLESVLDVLNPHLQANDLVVLQYPSKRDHGWALTTVVSLKNSETDLDQFEMPLLGIEESKNPMQALGSAITYARRYSLILYFKLVQTDDDGETVSPRDVTTTAQVVNNEQSAVRQALQVTTDNLPPENMWQDEAPRPPSNSKSYQLSEKQVKRFYAIARNSQWPFAKAEAYVTRKYNKKPSELSKQEYDAVCTYLESTPFDPSYANELKADVKPVGTVMEQFKEAKKQLYVDHTKGNGSLPNHAPTFEEEELPF